MRIFGENVRPSIPHKPTCQLNLACRLPTFRVHRGETAIAAATYSNLKSMLIGRARRLCTSAADAGVAQLRRQEAFVSAKTATQAIAKPARTALERYAELLQERPLLTNAVTSGVLCALGDVLAQLVEWRVGASDVHEDRHA